MERAQLLLIALTAAVSLGLCVLAGLRGRREPLALRLVGLTLVLFAYEAAELVGHWSAHSGIWTGISNGLGDLAVPAGIHFCVTFVGEGRRLRWLLFVSYAYFAALALVTVAMPYTFAGQGTWALLTLGGMLPGFGWVLRELVLYARRTRGEERLRTYLTLLSIALGMGGASTDLTSIASGGGPRLANFGILGSIVALGVVALRFRMLEGVTPLTLVTAGALAGFGVLAQVAVFNALGSSAAATFLGTLVVILILLLAARYVMGYWAEYRTRVAHHATLGRLAQQMAHDIRNPLAAIKGAAQMLQKNEDPATLARMLALIVEQSNRVNEVISTYQRLGKIELQREPLDATELALAVREAAQTAHPRAKIEARTNGAVPCRLDRHLMTVVLENLIRNASDATGGEGTIVIGARAEDARVAIEVEDDGEGMDARTLARVGDEFFTTKAQGTGLGLSFARRVAEAHGGAIQIESNPKKGTRVVVLLPREPA